MNIRTRFSPSPTGYLHIGGVRTTLFSALYAQKHQGVFVLRIEDTDALRSEAQYAESQMEDLRWLGINWQEGPGIDGPYGPYWQSARQEIYQRYYQLLKEKNLMYPCFCSDQELALARKTQLAKGQAPRYAGTCKKLSIEKQNQLLDAGKKPAWRFIVPEKESIKFLDTIKGAQQFESSEIGDFIIRRADGTAPFLFCNAIDDALMKITHVIRGEDHLSNTPRQIMLLKALALPEPMYGHLSLIVGEDGSKLSKRHGAFSVQEMRATGYLPLAILNYLTRLGHTLEHNELLSFNDLARDFNLDKISRSPARFDTQQLLFWQKLVIQHLDHAVLWQWLGKRVGNQVPENSKDLFIQTIKTNIAFPEEALQWAKIFFHENVILDENCQQVIQEAGEQFFVAAENAVNQHGLSLADILAEMKKTLGVNGKKLFMPLRAALTGQLHGPELASIAQLLGLKKMKHRLGQAFKTASMKN